MDMKGQTFTHRKSGRHYIVTDECEIKHYGLWVAGVIYRPTGEHPLASADKVYVRPLKAFEEKFVRTFPPDNSEMRLQV